MKITHRVLLFSILLLGACSAEESIAEEVVPPKPEIMDPFDRELVAIMSTLRSTTPMSRYSHKKEITTESDYTDKTIEYLFFDIRKTLFNTAVLTERSGEKIEFIKKHRTEGSLKEIKNPKILAKDSSGEYKIIGKPSNYTLYGWNFTHINRWYHEFKFWDDELPMLIGGKVPFFVNATQDKVIIKSVKYIIHSPELNQLPEVLYIINEPFGDTTKEITYNKDIL